MSPNVKITVSLFFVFDVCMCFLQKHHKNRGFSQSLPLFLYVWVQKVGSITGPQLAQTLVFILARILEGTCGPNH